jgi:hypothetical protein
MMCCMPMTRQSAKSTTKDGFIQSWILMFAFHDFIAWLETDTKRDSLDSATLLVEMKLLVQC